MNQPASSMQKGATLKNRTLIRSNSLHRPEKTRMTAARQANPAIYVIVDMMRFLRNSRSRLFHSFLATIMFIFGMFALHHVHDRLKMALAKLIEMPTLPA